MSVLIQIANKYHWELTGEPIRLHGGFMHTMYRIDTTRGTYALKLLNPHVMQRETAMDNFALAERLERLLEQADAPILPALSFHGTKMQEIDGRYFYVFDYFPGRPLQQNEIRESHCAEMGKALAKIHGIDRKYAPQIVSDMVIDWDRYLTQLRAVDARLYDLLNRALPVIRRSQQSGNRARKNLPPTVAVCHNDMDCKNVLWQGDDYRIIDLECLSHSNPFMELCETALCWSGYQHGQMDFQLFQAFLQGYKKAGGELPADWETVYDSNIGRLEWLEYNIKRVLGIDCGADEKEVGSQQVEETVEQILYYARMKESILAHCAV